MPLYISGPDDSEARIKQIVDTLHRRFGPDGYHYIVGASPFGIFFDDDEFDEDNLDEDEPEDEDEQEEGNDRS
jgi:hypothetical protein